MNRIKYTLLTGILTTGFMFCCSNQSPNDSGIEQTSEQKALNNAVEGNSSYSDLRSMERKYGYDQIGELFELYLEGNPKLEEKLEQYNDLKSEVVQFLREEQKIKDNSSGYYSSAEQYLDQISDSTLAQGIRKKLETSKKKFQTGCSEFDLSESKVQQSQKEVGDAVLALKLVKTLTLMEQYQQSHAPQKDKLQEYDKQLNEMLKAFRSEMN